jgi:Zn-dependent protease with chaperone function
VTNDQWDDLVRRRAQQAKSDPAGYRRVVGAWALAGYAVLIAALAFAVGGFLSIAVGVASGDVPVVLVKLAIPFGVVAFIIVRALSMRIAPPAGIELCPADAPELFGVIERLRERLDTPRIDHVLLDGDFNASIVQTPRLGPLGWARNYLTIGLAYMQALSPDELESVIAHELGHISRRHGRFACWIYRLRSSWGRFAYELDERGVAGAGLARRFLAWYVPRLQACSVALMREHEHEADRAAAEAVGAQHAARALVRATALAPTVSRYWDGVYSRVLDESTPPATAYRGLRQALREPPGGEGEAAVARALAMPTDTGDTHPALADRLAALGCAPATLDVGQVLAAPAASAADRLLGPDGHTQLSDRLSADWFATVLEGWSRRHAASAGEREELARLDARAGAGELDLAAARRRAELVEELRDAAAALAAWRDVLTLEPADGAAHLAVGSRLLATGDDAGLGHLDAAIASSPLLAVPAAERAYEYLAGAGRHDSAAPYRARLNRELDALDTAFAERRDLTRSDELQPHGLPPAQLAELRGALARIEGVAHAYVARKRVAVLADDAPLYVVGVRRATTWWRPERSDADAQLAQRVAAELALPGEFLAVSLAKSNRWLRRRLEQVDGALVFGR